MAVATPVEPRSVFQAHRDACPACRSATSSVCPVGRMAITASLDLLQQPSTPGVPWLVTSSLKSTIHDGHSVKPASVLGRFLR